jgi:hypothetical protein
MAQPLKDRIDCQFHATSLLSERLKFQVHLRVVYTNDAEEWGLFTSEGLHFAISYHHTSSQCGEMSGCFNMQSNYTVSDGGSKSVVIKMQGSEKIQVTIMVTEFSGSTELLPCVILNLKPYLRHI